MDWTLSDIRTKVRKLTGRPSTQQMSDATLDKYINQYYQNELPTELGTDEFVYWWKMTTLDGSGEYGFDADMIAPQAPCWLDIGNGYYKIWLTQDHELFFANYPPSTNDEAAEENVPCAALLYQKQLYLRPVPDKSTYNLKIPVLGRPQALSTGTDKPVEPSWGPIIAYGAAMAIKIDDQDFESATNISNVLLIKKAEAQGRQIYRDREKRVYPSF